MIDSHAHIYLEDFDADRSSMEDRARECGIDHVLMPNIDHTSIDRMLEQEERDPKRYLSMIGLHPCSVKKAFEKELYIVEDWLARRKFIAVGEIGTDLFWDKTLWTQQQEAFRIQCDLALKHKLPIVIHSRESIDETISLVTPFAERGLTGVFHCFTGDAKQAHQIKELGFCLGIGGVSTFKNSGLDIVLEKIGVDKILLETDSPYLAPVPYRGKRNEPSYLSQIAGKLSQIFKMEEDELISRTRAQTIELFKLNGSQNS